jgi:hypothetical protein
MFNVQVWIHTKLFGALRKDGVGGWDGGISSIIMNMCEYVWSCTLTRKQPQYTFRFMAPHWLGPKMLQIKYKATATIPDFLIFSLLVPVGEYVRGNVRGQQQRTSTNPASINSGCYF